MKLDPVTLEVMNNRLAAIAEEMGVVLGQTGYSPNIMSRESRNCLSPAAARQTCD
jgi:N-methylhydantoinase B/oxoprolinase/acetone carboxylase alpha subunit